MFWFHKLPNSKSTQPPGFFWGQGQVECVAQRSAVILSTRQRRISTIDDDAIGALGDPTFKPYKDVEKTKRTPKQIWEGHVSEVCPPVSEPPAAGPQAGAVPGERMRNFPKAFVGCFLPPPVSLASRTHCREQTVLSH